MLVREGYAVALAPDGETALQRFQTGDVDLVVSELKLPGLTGLDLLRAAKNADPDAEVIMMTAFATVERAVQAMKNGASDFLSKPLSRVEFISAVKQAFTRRAVVTEKRAMHQRLDELLRQGGKMLGVSPAFRRMMTLVQQVADSSACVLIHGENGTGKELVARSIHDRSSRRDAPFVVVNCAELSESELFGYEKGVSGSVSIAKEGSLALAEGGTLFLDEVADLPIAIQPKILRVLRNGEFERVGGTKSIRVQVRVSAATNQDLSRMVREKRFREDLFYRLKVITIECPPLRERPEDISVLAQHFLRVYAAKDNRRLDGFSDGALDRLEAHSWPGNVTELESAVQRAVILARGFRVELADLPDNVISQNVMLVPAEEGATTAGEGGKIFKVRIGTPLAEVERRLLEETLRLTRGNKTLTAKMLGIDPKTVFRKLQQHEIGGGLEPS